MKNKYLLILLVNFAVFTAFAQVPLATVKIVANAAVCNPGDCTPIKAIYTDLKDTGNYTVSRVFPYAPLPYAGGTQIADGGDHDDFWSPGIFTLPFKFCFFGNAYTNGMIGSNGVISFDIGAGPGVIPDGHCAWQITNPFPGPNYPNNSEPITNAIYGVYQDVHYANRNRSTSDVNWYIRDDGQFAAPNRILVVNYNELPQYNAGTAGSIAAGPQTSQIILHETTNIIEVNVKHRKRNDDWQAAALIGLMNHDGTIGVSPPGRNSVDFSADNESYRFVPNINAPIVPEIEWSYLDYTTGLPMTSNAPQINGCYNDTFPLRNIYNVKVTYTRCDGTKVSVTDQFTLTKGTFPTLTNPLNICTSSTVPFTQDIRQEGNMVPITEPVTNYNFTYWTNPVDANSGFGPSKIINPAACPVVALPMDVYVRVEDALGVGCQDIRKFSIIRQPEGAFKYSAADYCDDVTTPQLPQNVLLPTPLPPLTPNGTFSALDSSGNPTTALIINPTTGAITPSGSAVGIYKILYHINADPTGTCLAYDAPLVQVEIKNCTCTVVASNTTANICVGTALPTPSPLQFTVSAGTPTAASIDASGDPLPAGLTGTFITTAGAEKFVITGTPAVGATSVSNVIVSMTTALGTCYSVPITINIGTVPTITGTLGVCAGLTTTLIGSGTAAASNPWVSSNTAVATVDNTGVVTGVSAGTSVITYTNLAGCSITATVTVNALPTITGTLSVCAGLTTTLTGSATPATITPWFSATPAVATVSNTGVVTGVSAGTSVITYTNSNGCKITATVTVNALPTITGNLNVCIGSTTALTGSGTAATSNPWVSATPAVATIDNLGVVTGVSAGTSVITYTNSDGCIITATVTVNALPTITGTLSVCAGLTTTLTGSATPATSNAWASATPAVATVSNTGVVTGVSAGTSVITYTNSNGCKITATVTVNALPTITGTLNVCIGLTTALTGSGTAATSNPWVSATPAVATIDNLGVVTGVSAGTSVITYTNSDGCIITATVTVNALPTITGTLNVCIGLTTALTGSGSPSTSNPWASSNTAVATVDNTGVVTGVSAGTSVITYTNLAGCIITATVTVNALPTITGTLSVCAGLTTTLTGSATPATITPWFSATPAVATVSNTGVVTGVSAGTSVITYTNSNGCKITATVTVNALPTITGTLNVCIGSTTALTGSGTAATSNPWVSATPAVATIDNLGVVTGVSAGTSVITYTNSDGCIITATVTVNVLPTITGTLSVCAGLTTTLTGSATPAASNAWASATPAVATVSNTGVVTGVSAGTSVITYTNSNGCKITATVTVNALPTITGTLNICIGLTTALTGSGTAATSNPWVSATPAVATVSNTGVVTGVSAGTSVITYTNSDGCIITATVTVNALPTITGTLNVCIGSTTALTGSGTAAALNPWVSSNTAVATVDNTGVVTGVSAGTSVITYTNLAGCIITATVTVNALPTITGTLNVCAGLTTALTGSATPATLGAWVSATPAVATVSNTGVVTGVSAGTSVITYTNSNGCKITATVTVNALPTITGNLNVCIGSTTALTGSATAAATNPWTSSNTAVATVDNTGLVSGLSLGTTTITYTNSNGCVITATVTVDAIPTISGTFSVCAGLTTALTGSGTPATINPWVSSNTTVATVSNTGVVTGVSAGTSVITYRNSAGCSITATVTVNALPTITGTLDVCVGLTTTLTGSGTPSPVAAWVSSNLPVAIVSSTGVVTGVSPGTSVITYTNSNGCIITAIVTVHALPTITGTLNVCIGSTTALTGSGSPSTSNPWVSATPAVATVSNTGVVTGVSAGTSVITYTNLAGCIITATVTVNALPTITGTLSVCAGLTTTLIGSATPATSNAWASATPAVATVSNTGVVTGVSAGTSVITYTNSNGCKVTATVTVNALPTITGNLNVCIGSTTALTGSATAAATNPWTSSNTAVATVDNTGLVSGLSLGTTTITYTNSNGCVITATVTVDAIPTISGTFSVCAGLTTALTGSGTPATINPWVSSNTTVATVSNTGVVTGVSAGTSVITYRNSAGCSITATVTVNALPTITGTLDVCVGLTTTLTGSGIPSPVAAWVSSNLPVATVSSTGVVRGVSAGTSVITYTNSNGCIITAIVTVHALPTITGTLNVCIGSTTALTGSGSPSTSNPWVSATPAVATVSNSGVVTGVSAGTSVITYTNLAGCIVTATVTVNALPTITGTLNVCAGLTTALTGSATPATLGAWVSATPAVATVSNAGLVTGVSAGTSVITYTNSNGCKVTATVTVIAAPVITGTLNVCAGSTTVLTGSGIPSATIPWGSSNTTVATVSNTGVVTGVTAGTSVITYTNSNGCIITATVTVNALPTITGTLNVCAGLTTALTGSATAAPTNPWVSANTAVATVNSSGVVTGVSAGTSVITYTNANGCKITATVTVNALPRITGTLNVCTGSTTILTGSGSPAATNPWISSTRAVATVSNTGVVTGVSAGTSVITYTNSNGCTVTTTVEVNPLPTATLSGSTSVCQNDQKPKIVFAGFNGTAPYIFDYTIDGVAQTPITTSSTTNFIEMFANTNAIGLHNYIITKVTDKNCSQIQNEKVTIDVIGAPVLAGLTIDKAQICVGDGPATITATPPAGTYTFRWTRFPSGASDPGNTATFTTDVAGLYEVVIKSALGCESAPMSITLKVNPLPVVNLPQDKFVCVDPTGTVISRANLTTGLTGPYTFKWFDAAGEILGETASSYSAGAAGDYIVEVTNTLTGCVNTATATVTASFAPVSATYEVSNYFSETQLVTINVLPVGDYLYQVDNGPFQSSNQFYNLSSGYHDVVIKDRVGCGSIPINDIRIIAYPKFFTPNGDGYNDTWNIPDLSDQNASTILIFDRYGKLMKEISPKGTGWDGTLNGNPVPADDYWFKVYFIEQGSSKEFKAHFALKR